MNLFLTSFAGKGKGNYLVYHTGEEPRVQSRKEMHQCLKMGSHEKWWMLMETLRLADEHLGDELRFVLSRAYYEPAQRNHINYSFQYGMGGFPELDWFDTDVRNMMSHFQISQRSDRDITDADRFFTNDDPETVDYGDYAGDPIQVVWLSLVNHLHLIAKFKIKQKLITTEKVAALAEVQILGQYPNITRGILLKVIELLGDDFNVEEQLVRMRNARHWSFYSG